MKLAIIGGSLLPRLNGQSSFTRESIKTPFGRTSDDIYSAEIDAVDVLYFNRHGASHHIAPHQINYKANMFALKILDVTDIVSVTAVGGITQNMAPMVCVTPDQIIDYTHGRIHTYNDVNEGEVQHIDFTYPFDTDMRGRLQRAVAKQGLMLEASATYGVTQGPRLETIAEVDRMRRDGCDIVGMTAMPEAALARELEMRYSTLSLVVNWAAGADLRLPGNEAKVAEIITIDAIRERIAEGNVLAEQIISELISTVAG